MIIGSLKVRNLQKFDRRGASSIIMLITASFVTLEVSLGSIQFAREDIFKF